VGRAGTNFCSASLDLLPPEICQGILERSSVSQNRFRALSKSCLNKFSLRCHTLYFRGTFAGLLSRFSHLRLNPPPGPNWNKQLAAFVSYFGDGESLSSKEVLRDARVIHFVYHTNEPVARWHDESERGVGQSYPINLHLLHEVLLLCSNIKAVYEDYGSYERSLPNPNRFGHTTIRPCLGWDTENGLLDLESTMTLRVLDPILRKQDIWDVAQKHADDDGDDWMVESLADGRWRAFHQMEPYASWSDVWLEYAEEWRDSWFELGGGVNRKLWKSLWKSSLKLRSESVGSGVSESGESEDSKSGESEKSEDLDPPSCCEPYWDIGIWDKLTGGRFSLSSAAPA
jgi:hypothetical protein